MAGLALDQHGSAFREPDRLMTGRGHRPLYASSSRLSREFLRKTPLRNCTDHAGAETTSSQERPRRTSTIRHALRLDQFEQPIDAHGLFSVHRHKRNRCHRAGVYGSHTVLLRPLDIRDEVHQSLIRVDSTDTPPVTHCRIIHLNLAPNGVLAFVKEARPSMSATEAWRCHPTLP